MTEQHRALGHLEGRLAAVEQQVTRLEARLDAQMTIISSKLDTVTTHLAGIRGERHHARNVWVSSLAVPGAIAAIFSLATNWIGRH